MSTDAADGPSDSHVEVVVGRIGKPHGLRGEVTVDVRTDEPERRFAPGSTLRAGPAASGHAGRPRGTGAVRQGLGARGRPGRRPGRHRGPAGPRHPAPRRGRRVRLDYLTIFPDYLAPLRQSLTGRAADKGLIEL